jgi:hypothetical protein
MTSSRSSHVNRIRGCASIIFGAGFEPDWFASKFNRGSVEKLQELVGARVSSKGKGYLLLPPILYPDGSQNKKDIFLNPALVKASILSNQVFGT